MLVGKGVPAVLPRLGGRGVSLHEQQVKKRIESGVRVEVEDRGYALRMIHRWLWFVEAELGDLRV